MRDFPQELVDLIIDDVAATTNTRDIGTCGWVCRRWLPRSRMRLFSCLTIWNALPRDNRKKAFFDTAPATTQSFLDLADASLIPILPLVRKLNINVVLHGPWPLEQDMIHTHVSRFGASLTRFKLRLPTNLPLHYHILADLLSGLPFLEELQIRLETFGVGIVDPQNALPPATFPPSLHTLDIELHQGTSLFFR
ncbi:hypothetical protein MVEN_01656900 [Mycena venus]|uniref:Uncharacterized protein n=1 Tax=Mycena venus TaxID=2733690 RepID=A0A8H6XND5_9AGAR|nr:hypothetical protein MVEN_01656900 [Mycena venus]